MLQCLLGLKRTIFELALPVLLTLYSLMYNNAVIYICEYHFSSMNLISSVT